MIKAYIRNLGYADRAILAMPILIDSDIPRIKVIRGKIFLSEMKWSELVASKQQILVSPASIAELWQGSSS